jgi:RNA polymerase sigma-70 factor (sigma-E family)
VKVEYLSDRGRGDYVADDEIHLDLIQDRDDAITTMFLAHHARLVGLARLLVDDIPTAEDVVQDAFVSLYRHWSSIRDKSAALQYLQSSVVNGSRSSLRRRRVARSVSVVPPESAPSAEVSLVAVEEGRALRAALAQLPSRQRQVIVLRYFLDWSEREIADALSIGRGSVKQHTSRAIVALSSILEAVR